MNAFQPLPLHNGELYVEMATREHDERTPGGAIFPARLPADDAPPLFRREVVEQISHWLAVTHHADPGLDLCHFEGDSLVLFETGRPENRREILAGEDGLYPLGEEMPCFFPSGPSNPDADAALLADRHRLTAHPGEVLVVQGITEDEPGFPALIESHTWNGSVIPRFRREVAEVVAAWTNELFRRYPDGTERAYWVDDVLVLIMSNCSSDMPERVAPDDDGRYAIGASRWTWELPD